MNLAGSALFIEERKQKAQNKIKGISGKVVYIGMDEQGDDKELDYIEGLKDNASEPVTHKSTPLSFELGFVHKAVRGAVSTYLRKTAETSILALALEEQIALGETFIGAIYIKPSFVHKSGGSVLI